jgi:hypothetical protein
MTIRASILTVAIVSLYFFFVLLSRAKGRGPTCPCKVTTLNFIREMDLCEGSKSYSSRPPFSSNPCAILTFNL